MTSLPSRLLALTLVLAPGAASAAPEAMRTSTIALRHASASDANAHVRALFSVRHLTVDEALESITVRDAEAVVAEAEAFLRAYDVPRPAWSAELVATCGGADRVLRRLELAPGATATYGLPGDPNVRVALESKRASSASADVEYEVTLNLSPQGGPGHRFNERGKVTVEAGHRLGVAAPASSQQQAALGTYLGCGEPVRDLFVRFLPSPR
jgi:hypothetical protein